MKRILVAIGVLVAALLPVTLTAPAHADPCFFTDGDFSDLRAEAGNGWGDNLAHVEDVVANCTGTWTLSGDTWNGHSEKTRVWPMRDGSTVELNFAVYDTGDRFRFHDVAYTHTHTGSQQKYCEWPRNGNGPC